MNLENIDYDALKKRGFLRQKQEGFFVLRTRMSKGVYTKGHLEELKRIAEVYGRGFLHATVRQGLEVPFIKFEDIEIVEQKLHAAGIEIGTSGPRLRTTICCPGNNWCKSGLVNTFLLADKIENELNIKCGLDLPHKFKIAISGCPNTCTRPQASEIGLHGVIDPVTKQAGFVVYLGGCGGRDPKAGFKLDNVLSEEKVLSLVERVVKFYKNKAKPRQRLAFLIDEFGRDKFLNEIGY